MAPPAVQLTFRAIGHISELGVPVGLAESRSIIAIGFAATQPDEAGAMTTYDSQSGKALSALQVGSDPVGMSVAGSTIWVANGVGSGAGPYRGAGTVDRVEVGSNGHLALARTYAVQGVLEVAADSTVAYAIASTSQTGSPLVVYKLTAAGPVRQATMSLTLSGEGAGGPTAAVCEGTLSVVGSRDDGSLAWSTLTRAGKVQYGTIATGGSGSVTCAGPIPVAVVSAATGGGYQCLAQAAACATGRFGVPMSAAIVVSSIWLLGMRPAEFASRSGLHLYELSKGLDSGTWQVPAAGNALLGGDSQHPLLLINSTMYAISISV